MDCERGEWGITGVVTGAMKGVLGVERAATEVTAGARVLDWEAAAAVRAWLCSWNT